ncbi:hypothetical protein COCMIDRAFT_281 [Bipolaris oryzae ATCC 44560]|uniref:Uncharacterized protein n=1 Tax=Bipolaris oryzae ATCC 44560 TaxID=930090 RepID=W6ZU34_COCMI|nr:uncharacterized protein COCMIDRAFT_281 [Bipolaris oryzae ATCC 44560]EUC51059.1 hypothetical protein COCMIDRAFT_281 [Bipolaris oryzae ATCC 44560]
MEQSSSSEPVQSTRTLSEENLSQHNAAPYFQHHEASLEPLDYQDMLKQRWRPSFYEQVTLADCMESRVQAAAERTSAMGFDASSNLSHGRSTICASIHNTDPTAGFRASPKLAPQDTLDVTAVLTSWAVNDEILSLPEIMSPWPSSLCAEIDENLEPQEVLTTPETVIPKQRKTQKGLPLIFKVDSGSEEIMTGHDTGTEANHMSLELAQKLGYKINREEQEKGLFQLPTGKIIESVGQVIAQIQFAQGEGSKTSTFTCQFNVFSKLAMPALIGMAFLNATETLTTYRSRLATLPAGWKRSLRLCAVGNATNEVNCVLNGRDAKAIADTGSEIALVSGEYALRHGLLYEYSCEELELADGSLEHTSGFVDLVLAIQDPGSHDRKWTEKKVRFHVLESLRFEVLLDEAIVEDFKIFQRGIAFMLQLTSNITASLASIAHLRTIDQSVANGKEKLKRRWALLLQSVQLYTDTTSAPPVSGQPTFSLEKAEIEKEIRTLDKKRLQRRAEFRKTSPTVAETERSNQEESQYRAEREVLVQKLKALYPP